MRQDQAKLPSFIETRNALTLRRKLMFALMGGLLMKAIVPLNAAAAEKNQKADKVTEEMMFDFLRALYKIQEHNDLADIGFIERALGVEIVPSLNEVTIDGENHKHYNIKRKGLLSRLIKNSVNNEFDVIMPAPGGTVGPSLSLDIAEDSRITMEMMVKVFGPLPTPVPALSIFTTGVVYQSVAYVWPHQHDMVSAFNFMGDPWAGFLADVRLFRDIRLSHSTNNRGHTL